MEGAKQEKQAPHSCSAQLLRRGNRGNMECSHWGPKQWAGKISEHCLSIPGKPLVPLRADCKRGKKSQVRSTEKTNW